MPAQGFELAPLLITLDRRGLILRGEVAEDDSRTGPPGAAGHGWGRIRHPRIRCSVDQWNRECELRYSWLC